jgi:hypothetical protein
MYRSARCRRQDGTLHNRVHEATGGSRRLALVTITSAFAVDQFGNEVTKSLELSIDLLAWAR